MKLAYEVIGFSETPTEIEEPTFDTLRHIPDADLIICELLNVPSDTVEGYSGRLIAFLKGDERGIEGALADRSPKKWYHAPIRQVSVAKKPT